MNTTIEEFAKDLGLISNYFKKQMHSIKLEECNIKDCITIEALSKSDLSMLELAEILNLSPSATTTHIDKLIERNIVLRENDKIDRRKINITLSKKGKLVRNSIMLKHLEISEILLKKLDEKEIKVFSKLFKKIAKNLE